MDELIEIRGNPVPPTAKVGSLTTPDGIRLRYATWKPDGLKRRGTVTLLQGRAEFIEKYFEVIEELRRRGFGVVTFDWRGQGGSQRLLPNPRKGHVGNFDDYQVDFDTITEKIGLADMAGPHFLLAHSMGANVALLSASRIRTRFDRLVLSAPLIGLPFGAGSLRWRLVYGLDRLGLSKMFIPGGGATAIPTIPFVLNAVTSDRKRHSRTARIVEAAPQLGLGSPTIGWVRATLDSFAKLGDPRFAGEVKLPVLMLAAGRERVVSNLAIERFSAALPSGGHVFIPGAKHELMMERDIVRDQFWKAFDSFVPGVELYEAPTGAVSPRSDGRK